LGVRDLGLLESALAQPQASFNGSLLHPTIAEQAAAYLYHISRNHPFIDGNKRTAFGVMEAFIRVNGYLLNLSNEEKYDLVLRSAQGELGKTELSELLRANLIQLQE
jgi:death-on-curing protein